MVDVHVVNALLEVHVKALREDEIDGLILPLFTKYDLKRTGETYELLMGTIYLKQYYFIN